MFQYSRCFKCFDTVLVLNASISSQHTDIGSNKNLESPKEGSFHLGATLERLKTTQEKEREMQQNGKSKKRIRQKTLNGKCLETVDTMSTTRENHYVR